MVVVVGGPLGTAVRCAEGDKIQRVSHVDSHPRAKEVSLTHMKQPHAGDLRRFEACLLSCAIVRRHQSNFWIQKVGAMSNRSVVHSLSSSVFDWATLGPAGGSCDCML